MVSLFLVSKSMTRHPQAADDVAQTTIQVVWANGIFAIYIQCVLSTESRTTSIVFYSLCLLYLLSTATIVSDFTRFDT